MGVVCHGRQSRQAQHLRLPRARHDDLPSRSRDGTARAREVSLRVSPDREAKTFFDSGWHLVLGHRRPGGGAIEHPDGPRDVSPGGRAERRAAVRSPAARYSRHDGDLLLLRDRPEPIRGREHGVWRHPQTARHGERRRADGSDRSAESDHQATGPGDSPQGTDAERSRSRDHRRAPGEGGCAAADDDPLEPLGEDGDGGDRGAIAPPRARQDEPLGRSRLPRQLLRAAARHGAAAA